MGQQKERKRFAVGTRVLVRRPGIAGVVTQLDDTPKQLWEYWHTIQTAQGERREPGCNLELIPVPMTNAGAEATVPIGKRRGQAWRR